MEIGLKEGRKREVKKRGKEGRREETEGRGKGESEERAVGAKRKTNRQTYTDRIRYMLMFSYPYCLSFISPCLSSSVTISFFTIQSAFFDAENTLKDCRTKPRV